jgi:hypothetical protein
VSVTTIVLIDASPTGELAAELEASAPFIVHRINAVDRSVPLMCNEISALDPISPLLIVTNATDASILPGIALAQRAAHRRIAGSVLIEPVQVSTSESWPESPVFVTTSVAAPDRVAAALRGWNVLRAETIDDQVRAIINAATSVE